jgi:hypothetical protein
MDQYIKVSSKTVGRMEKVSSLESMGRLMKACGIMVDIMVGEDSLLLRVMSTLASFTWVNLWIDYKSN